MAETRVENIKARFAEFEEDIGAVLKDTQVVTREIIKAGGLPEKSAQTKLRERSERYKKEDKSSPSRTDGKISEAGNLGGRRKREEKRRREKADERRYGS